MLNARAANSLVPFLAIANLNSKSGISSAGVSSDRALSTLDSDVLPQCLNER